MNNDANLIASSNGQEPSAFSSTTAGAADLYLDLLKKCLTRYIFDEKGYVPYGADRGTWVGRLYEPVRQVLATKGFLLAKKYAFDAHKRAEGADWPGEAETMIGLRRLDNLQACIVDVLRSRTPGDFIETGVWRGGACIFMRAVLKAYGDATRKVWVADSFEGLPAPNPDMYPADTGDKHFTVSRLAISVEQVRDNFSRYGLLDDQVRFLKGWFKDTLGSAPIERLAVLRLDGDMYESTMDSLVALYPKVSVGGFVIVDDYGALPGCREAIHDYRDRNGIRENMTAIDSSGAVYWKRETA